MDVRFSFLLPEREGEVLRVLRQMVEDDAPTCVCWDGFLVAELDSQAAAGTPVKLMMMMLAVAYSLFNSGVCAFSAVLLRTAREALRRVLRPGGARCGKPGLACGVGRFPPPEVRSPHSGLSCLLMVVWCASWRWWQNEGPRVGAAQHGGYVAIICERDDGLLTCRQIRTTTG
jgi:hypothetical protein